MALEKLTKAELVKCIQKNADRNSDNLERDILFIRQESIQEKAHQARRGAIDALGEYIEALKPYAGVPIHQIPIDVIERAEAAHERYVKCTKSAERYEIQEAKISHEVNEKLGIT